MKKYYVIFIMLIMVQFSFAQKVSVPQPTSPENEYEFAFPNATLNWVAVSGVGDISYHVQMATEESFSDLVLDLEGVEMSAYFNHNLDFGQQYFWRVKALDDNGTSDWSTVFTFTTFAEGVQNKPKDGKDDIDIRPKFSWKDKVDGNILQGFDGFDVEIDTTEDFSSPYAAIFKSGKEENGTISKDLVMDYLLFGQMNYWRIRPMHAAGHGVWSETRSFETVVGIETKKPSDGDDEIEFDEKLTWDDLENNEGIFDYFCQVSTDEDFSNPVTLEVQETELLPEFYKFGTQYFWRVKAAHINDESPFSEVSTFETINMIELDEPADGERLNTYRPTLKWEDIKAIDGYQIKISQNADMSNADYYNVPNAGSNSFPLNELDKSDYYWTVRAYNGNDTCDWAESFSFSTLYVGIDEISSISNLSIAPNPAVNSVNVEFTSTDNTPIVITIMDVLGKTVVSQNLGSVSGVYSKSFDISDLESGMYILEMKKGTATTSQKFLVK